MFGGQRPRDKFKRPLSDQTHFMEMIYTRFKYIIPLTLCAIMVMAVLPAHARDVGIAGCGSQVVNYKNAQWTYAPSGSYDVSSGDRVYWYNTWYHGDSGYQGNYQVGGYYKFSNTGQALMRDSNGNGIIYYISYHQQISNVPAYASVSGSPSSITRWHNYFSTDDWSLHQTSGNTLTLT